MRLNVVDTPRRIARLSRHSPIVAKVLSGALRIAQRQEELYNGEGMPLVPTDGIVNWVMPEGEIWIVADSTNTVLEIMMP